MSAKREALRTAIAAHDEVKASLTATEAALKEAKFIQDETAFTASEYAHLDNEIAEHRAARMKAQIVSGNKPQVAALPAELVENQRKRALVTETLNSINSVVVSLEKDLQSGQMVAASAAHQVDLAVEAVVAEELVQKAEDFFKTLSALAPTYYQITSMAQQKVRTDPNIAMGHRAMILPPIVHNAARQFGVVGDLELIKGPKIRDDAMLAAATFMRNLRSDADAKFD